MLNFVESKYEISDGNFYYQHIHSYDGFHYICRTCDAKLKKKKIPCQAVCNKLEIFQFPDDMPCLNRLEKVIISKRILFA